MSKFENPYNFVPAPPRKTNADQPLTGPLGDAESAGHDRYYPDLWSGRLNVTLTTCTPLLMVDASRAEEAANGHKTYGMRKNPDGRAYIPPTSVRGMLRAAFEAITNSRMGVLDDHKERLALRQAARNSGNIVPARVSDNGESIELLTGTEEIPTDDPRPPHVMYAAWLPRYGAAKRLLQEGEQHARHGRRVWAELEYWRHYIPRERGGEPNKNNFDYWRVVRLLPDSENPPAEPFLSHNRNPVEQPQRSRNVPDAKEPHRWVRGWVMETNKNMPNKHDERVFFVDPHSASDMQRLRLTDDHRRQWRTLITNYWQEHSEKFANKKAQDRAPEQRDPVRLSRHIAAHSEAERDLAPGTLCYAKVCRNSNGGLELKALYPVMISRDLFESSPEALLDRSLQPAGKLEGLSPADRVFGWVKGRGTRAGRSAYMGQLRVGSLRCETDDAIEQLGADGQTLTILGQPKPSQASFYVAETPAGEPLKGKAKADGYKPGQGLRGRKVYPHHAQAAKTAGYWSSTKTAPLDAEGIHREWQQAGAAKSNQNRTIREWIRPGATFSFDIDIINLQPEELGALLWLLRMKDDHYFRLGGGKPLGFGSVRLTLNQIDLCTGNAMRDYFRDLTDLGVHSARQPGKDALKGTVEDQQVEIDKHVSAFEDALTKQFGKETRERILTSFLNAACGGKHPVHYPRPTSLPQRDAENFKWFTSNEKRRDVLPEVLPELWAEDRGLTIDE